MLIALVLFLAAAYAGLQTHIYSPGDPVAIWFGTVGPRANRQESYPLLSLPYCTGPKLHPDYTPTIGQSLLGLEFTDSGMQVEFARNVSSTALCNVVLDAHLANMFKYALAVDYIHQTNVDGLPVIS